MISHIKKRLKLYEGRRIECPDSTMAGVLIPVFEREGEACLLLTERTHTVKHHKGEISFPGGVYEDRDGNIMETALRESYEEIGLEKRDVEIIGRLDDNYTLTGFVITPFVGVVPYPYSFRTSPDEVASVISLPYNYLRTAEPTIEIIRYNGKEKKNPSIHFNGNRIWGATCRILFRFRDIIENRTA